ncbi:MAG: hypothetical protein M5U34_29090 [Chloroflexi bacterium]|nr:hypothetical protein [Chloroflexota bacterium]
MAAELLPLWRAMQSLSNSETAADAEVTAVLNQIQDTLSADQVAAIAAMQLTDESFQAMLAEGTISMRGVFGGNRNAVGGTGSGRGGGPGGGLGGGFGQVVLLAAVYPVMIRTLNRLRIAERIAESGGDSANFQALAMINAVVRLLEGKTGEAPTGDFSGGGLFGEAITAVSETTGLTVENVQAALGEGQNLGRHH